MEHCLLCQSTKITTASVKDGLIIKNCPNCRNSFLSNASLKNIKNLYNNKSYYNFWGSVEKEAIIEVEKVKSATFKKLIKEIEKLQKPGRLLEIGCATGVLLDLAEKIGWRVSGVECYKKFAQIAQNKIKGKITTGMFEDAVYKKDYFDAVVLYDSIEHFKNPVSALEKINKIMKKNGLLVIATPNIKSLSAKIMGKYWTHYKSEHLFYFSPLGIKKILSEKGFYKIIINNALKALSINYINNQFSAFPTPLFSGLFKILSRITPANFADKPFFLTSGEMIIFAQKNPL